MADHSFFQFDSDLRHEDSKATQQHLSDAALCERLQRGREVAEQHVLTFRTATAANGFQRPLELGGARRDGGHSLEHPKHCGEAVKAAPHLGRPVAAYRGSVRRSHSAGAFPLAIGISTLHRLYALPLPTSPSTSGRYYQESRPFQDGARPVTNITFAQGQRQAPEATPAWGKVSQ
ncbi:hypothetical protein CORC01_04323 [Colletotrichum orchidophilum]|uniref:Uncharacterized protein n=1 Tax=Colletotrichum orchidophilum TaxID=1209926 RepID=A0A1G4BFX9_9PEZI|nr:uncharacterized protein CORC01_04323 [Colletotrichum orchidophilum]OHF00342.1 hypothetical protein CORC01_04323 [Colletotrichum orchidophilum]